MKDNEVKAIDAVKTHCKINGIKECCKFMYLIKMSEGVSKMNLLFDIFNLSDTEHVFELA